MSLLELVIVITGVVFLLVAVDLYQRKKFNLLHFLVFFGGTTMIVLFVVKPELLSRFGGFFGVARGADLVVYVSIIFLAYFYFETLNQLTKTNYHMTRLCASQALNKFRESQQFDHMINVAKKDKSNVAFLMRAYNEAATIGVVIDEIVEAGYSKLVIVDDGSYDKTVEIVKEKQQEYPDKAILIISHLINRGGGAANKTLFRFADQRGKYLDVDWRVTFDADGQMDVADLERFMKHADHDEYDILLGSRFAQGGEAFNMPALRRIILWGAKFVTLLFNKIRVSDPHNGYRLIHDSVVGDFRIESDGMTYASEILDEIKRLNLRYREVGVNIRYTDYSLSKGQKNTNALNILSELIYKTFFYK